MKHKRFFKLLKALQTRVLDAVGLTELMVALIDIMYQHPGPLPSDTSQTGGVSTIIYTHTDIIHVIDFGPPP